MFKLIKYLCLILVSMSGVISCTVVESDYYGPPPGVEVRNYYPPHYHNRAYRHSPPMPAVPSAAAVHRHPSGHNRPMHGHETRNAAGRHHEVARQPILPRPNRHEHANANNRHQHPSAVDNHSESGQNVHGHP